MPGTVRSLGELGTDCLLVSDPLFLFSFAPGLLLLSHSLEGAGGIFGFVIVINRSRDGVFAVGFERTTTATELLTLG
jgi:hypothetical protein